MNRHEIDFSLEIEKAIVESEAERKGLWHNIREKRKREGKNYRPAKLGDKDRPDPEAYKKAQEKKPKAD